ncbi:hypothetical protein K9M06_02885 [Candidatus Bipolaricaulota bacterium]|nr:hypothetical protein [Candidatus Bipolaricaulota bacterium]
METVYCPICGKEYKNVKMHIRKGHEREPEEVIEEAFGQKLTQEERQKGAFQQQQIEEMRSRVRGRTSDLRETQMNRLKEMNNTWQDRKKTYDKVMKERIENITNK